MGEKWYIYKSILKKKKKLNVLKLYKPSRDF